MTTDRRSFLRNIAAALYFNYRSDGDCFIDAHISRRHLTAHRSAGDREQATGNGKQGDPARPDVVLFNGGVFASPVLRQRLLDCLTDWFDQPRVPSPESRAPSPRGG